MNKERRDRLDKIITTISDAKDEIQEVMNDEQEAFDNLPESLQMSDRGTTMDAAINEMQSAIDAIDQAESSLETARE